MDITSPETKIFDFFASSLPAVRVSQHQVFNLYQNRAHPKWAKQETLIGPGTQQGQGKTIPKKRKTNNEGKPFSIPPVRIENPR